MVLSTLLLTTVLLTFLAGSALLAMHRSSPSLRGVSRMSVCYFSGCACAVLLLSRNHTPEIVWVLAANFAFLLCYILMHLAILDFFGKASHVSLLSGVLVAVDLGFCSYSIAQGGKGYLRIVLISILISIQLAQTLLALKKELRTNMRTPVLGYMVVLSVVTVGYLVRAGLALAIGSADGIVGNGILQVLAILTLIFSIVGSAFAFIWMTTTRLHLELEHLASTDPLTKSLNRRAIQTQFRRELELAGRNGSPLSLITLDIDHFKAINDQHGHVAGDVVLRTVVGELQEHSRTTDTLGRMGGEEFLILLPASNREEAAAVADRLRAALAKLRIMHGDKIISVTASLGVTEVSARHAGWEECWEDSLRRGDTALYAAKQSGRNCVFSLEEGPAFEHIKEAASASSREKSPGTSAVPLLINLEVER